jgi:hypothetical protein
MSWYNQGEGRERPLSDLGRISFYVLAVCAIAGAVLLRQRRVLVWPLVSTAVIVTITAIAFYGLVRFRVPAEVAIAVLAAVAVDELISRVRPQEPADTPVGAEVTREPAAGLGTS